MKPLVSILLSMLILNTYAQSDSLSNAYTRIMSQVQGYQIDTTTPPTDKTTRLIGQLRELRGGFNINEAVLFKIGEEENKKEKSKDELEMIKTSFIIGKGKTWLDNAVTWIYRHHFTYRELKQLVKFYKTPAGQKLSSAFPVIMLKTLAAAQIIHDTLIKENKPATN